jgi:hypothetical protein
MTKWPTPVNANPNVKQLMPIHMQNKLVPIHMSKQVRANSKCKTVSANDQTNSPKSVNLRKEYVLWLIYFPGATSTLKNRKKPTYA